MIPIDLDQFRKASKQYSKEIQNTMSMFRHLSNRDQIKFLYELQLNSLTVVEYLSQVKELDNYSKKAHLDNITERSSE